MSEGMSRRGWLRGLAAGLAAWAGGWRGRTAAAPPGPARAPLAPPACGMPFGLKWTEPLGYVTTYSYDFAGRLISVTESGPSATYPYDAGPPNASA